MIEGQIFLRIIEITAELNRMSLPPPKRKKFIRKTKSKAAINRKIKRAIDRAMKIVNLTIELRTLLIPIPNYPPGGIVQETGPEVFIMPKK